MSRALAPLTVNSPESSRPRLRLRRLGIDTHQELVVYMREDCSVCRSEGFEAHSRVEVRTGPRAIIATVNVVHDHLLEDGEAGLSESAWRRLGCEPGDRAQVSHAPPIESLRHVRAKVYGQSLDEPAFEEIIRDVAAGHYTDVGLAAFVAACGGERLTVDEISALTRAMVTSGSRLSWPAAMVVDKHCVGGLPGNRTTPIIVAIATALGLTMPKTSSRAITSPAGTADVMETLAPVDLPLAKIRSVVEHEGGCIVWGGAVSLSPADDVLIRVERALDIDSEGQLIASVLSKKIAAGSTHVILDVPVGATAKVRSLEAARRLAAALETVSARNGLVARAILTDGTAPVGRAIGPSLEAFDVLAVLRGDADAPADLRRRALLLAGELLELAGRAEVGRGAVLAETVLHDGRAWTKFQAICRAQGGMRQPPRAPLVHVVEADRSALVCGIDNRKLARVAKLAGAPAARAAGVELHVRDGGSVERGAPLFSVHAETPGELAYSLDYVRAAGRIFALAERR